MDRTHPKGIVKEVFRDKIVVVFSRSSACGKCEACGMLKETGDMFIDFRRHDDNVFVGDIVNVEVNERFFLLSALLLYGIPLICLLVGIALATIVLGEDFQILNALIGMGMAVGAFYFLKIFKSKFEKMKIKYMDYSL